MTAFKQKLLNQEKVFGTQVMMNDPAITDIFTSFGYDFLWIDTEHSPIDYAMLLQHITLCEAKGAAAMVRMHIDDYNHTKRVLEMGPSGVIFPMINTREDAEKAIRSTYYPPRGNRGIGAQRFSQYGKESIPSLTEKQNDLVRCVQIESRQAVDNLEEIVQVEGIDCFIFGMWDLSFDLGKPDDVFSDEEMAYVRRAIDILKRHHKAIGVAGTPRGDFLRKWSDLGITCFTSGSDFDFLRMGAESNLRELDRIR